MTKRLSELLEGVHVPESRRLSDMPVDRVDYLAEEAGPRSLFFCVDEFLRYSRWMEGGAQAPDALARGVRAFVVEVTVPGLEGAIQIAVPDARKAMAVAAKRLYGAPDEGMTVVGVTGTNGKTTVSHLVGHLLTGSGVRAASMGTIGLFVAGEKVADAVYTTPLSPRLFETLSHLREGGVSAAALEISSHSIKLDRVWGLDVDVAVFTNLTRDHLDFHPDMGDYAATKMGLFARLKPSATAVLNADDPFGLELARRAPCRAVTYGFSPDADLRVVGAAYRPDRTEIRMAYGGVEVMSSPRVAGRFNVSNMLAGAAACLALGLELGEVGKWLDSFHSVPGRMEIVPLPGGRTAIVDYAHTPDALEKVLAAIRETTGGRIVAVFGCGGDRDTGKRPLMGAAVERGADVAVVTSDNPRTEDPEAIIRDILRGMSAPAVVEVDRRAAIRAAYALSGEGDVLLVAGKGHEDYQIVGVEKTHYNDKEELQCLWKQAGSDSPTPGR